MPVKESPKTYTASDGTEFDSKAEAERYDNLLQAKEKYDSARTLLCRALAESQKTADGVAFEFGVFRDYYSILEWDGFPRLHTVQSLYMHSNEDFELEQDGTIYLVEQRATNQRRTYRIGELYYHESEAKKALVEVREKRLAEWTKETAELKAKLED